MVRVEGHRGLGLRVLGLGSHGLGGLSTSRKCSKEFGGAATPFGLV